MCRRASLDASQEALVERLGQDAELPRVWAVPFVRYGGRCAYCGRDLLVDRLGYAAAQIDHLLPKAHYGQYEDWEDNWVLSCSLCNWVKLDWDPLQGDRDNAGAKLESEDERRKLIENARGYIREQRGERWDDGWRAACQVLTGADPVSSA